MIETHKPYVAFLGKGKRALMIPPQDPQNTQIIKELFSAEERLQINAALKGIIFETGTIDSLNEFKRLHRNEDVVFEKVREFVYNHAFAHHLREGVELAVGRGIGFINALVAADAVTFKEGLQLVNAEALSIYAAPGSAYIHTPEFTPYKTIILNELEGISVKEAKIPVILPTNGRKTKNSNEIRYEIENYLTTPYNDELVNKTLEEEKISRLLRIGTKVTENRGKAAFAGAVLVGAGIILAHYIGKKICTI